MTRELSSSWLGRLLALTVSVTIVQGFSSLSSMSSLSRSSSGRHQPKQVTNRQHIPNVKPRTTVCLAKDWDAILKQIEEEEEEEGEGNMSSSSDNPSSSNMIIPPDMQYNPRNCQRQQRHYQQMRALNDPELFHDVYIRDPKDDTQVVWFIGKLSHVSDVSTADAVRRQWNLMETHAVNLRPMDLFKAKNELEFWLAPGDSELEVAYNRPSLVLQKIDKIIDHDMEAAARINEIPNIMVGFQGEIYDAGEPGFRTWRLPDGSPARPEITGPQEQQLQQAAERMRQPTETGEEEYRMPTDEEMEQLRESLKGKDIEELWREQQRRDGKEIDDDDD